MPICPNCQTENRPGAKFCKSCATRLPNPAAVTLKLDQIPKTASQNQASFQDSQVTRRVNLKARTHTRPLNANNDEFLPRPPGAVFGEIFLFKSEISSNNQQNQYKVSILETLGDSQIRSCPNTNCGAYFPPENMLPEKFCTSCGTELTPSTGDLLLLESRLPLHETIVRIASKALSHSHIRAPLLTFVERLGTVERHCLVAPFTNDFKAEKFNLRKSESQLLEWAEGLTLGLDYLHQNGVGFGGKMDNTCFGLDGKNVVWSDFDNCSLSVDGLGGESINDLRSLALIVFKWLTGKDHYEKDPRLNPATNLVFESVLGSINVITGKQLADLFHHAAIADFPQKDIDYRLGRKTHVGMVRSLNEDSILTLEFNCIKQSISRPMGLLVVADGMGGHAAGEIASSSIVDTMARMALDDLFSNRTQGQTSEPGEWLKRAVEAANHEVYKLRKTSESDMGSTLVAAVIDGNIAYITHVGDSRAYLINSGGIQRLTTDHSLVERLIASNQLTREEARFHPQRNVIYRTIGDKSTVEIEISQVILSQDDHLLLCSDGLCGILEDSMIERIVTGTESVQSACNKLVDAANISAGEDNISAILVKIVPA